MEAIGGAAATEDPFGWREPMLPPGRSASLPRAIERWRAGRSATVPIAEEEADDARPAVPPGIVASRHAPGAERSPAPADRARLRPGAPPLGAAGPGGDPRRRDVPPGRRAAPRGRDARRAQPERGVRGWAGRPRARHGPRAVRGRARPPAEGAPPRRPARHPRAPHPGRPGRPRRPRDRPLRADAPAGERWRRARLPGDRLRGHGPDLRARRADQPGQPLRRCGAAGPLEARRRRVGPDEGARPQGRLGPGRGAARAVRGPGRRRGPRLPARHALAGRSSKPPSRTRRRRTSSARSST